jgi:hypothetical protein
MRKKTLSSNKTVKVEARLASDNPQVDPWFKGILDSALDKRPIIENECRLPFNEYWKPSHFGLDRVALFNQASPNEKVEITRTCIQSLMTEAYFIEKAGLCFNAKMVLLSETTEERVLYSLFGAEEATHFRQIEGFMPKGTALRPENPFIHLLIETIEGGGKSSLTYLIQVVLEGWGLAHYQSMAHGCKNASLSQALHNILKDEALHHGSGVALLDRQSIPKTDKEFITEMLFRLLHMVQIGPQAVASAICQTKGHLSRAQRIKIFQELCVEEESGKRLAHLRSLMSNHNSIAILESLDKNGLFRPYRPEECAASMVA